MMDAERMCLMCLMQCVSCVSCNVSYRFYQENAIQFYLNIYLIFRMEKDGAAFPLLQGGNENGVLPGMPYAGIHFHASRVPGQA
jgi:hypothetical protein